MSDTQKLRDVITEYRKANKDLDDKLTKAEQRVRQARREREDEQRRPK